jgi:Helix-turn-helix domain
MSMVFTGLGDDEGRGGQGDRRGILGPQWDDRDAFTVEETGKILGISRASAFAAAKKGQIPTLRIGKRLIVPRRALERLLNAPGDNGEQGDGRAYAGPRGGR